MWLKRFLPRIFDPAYRRFRQAVRRYKHERSRAVITEFPSLNRDSIAFDFGGFRGEWAAALADRYDLNVHVFEPHPGFAAAIAERFAGNQKIRCHSFALSGSDGRFLLSDAGDASSGHKTGPGRSVSCRMVSVARFFSEQTIPHIDVVKMNIEGGEYDLLPALIDGGIIGRVETLLVQFHNFEAGDPARRDAIRMRLAETHVCEWSYEFVWELWTRANRPDALQPGM